MYYEIIDDWAKDHLNNPKTLAQKSDYDYKKIIANYNELEEIVSNHFKNLELIWNTMFTLHTEEQDHGAFAKWSQAPFVHTVELQTTGTIPQTSIFASTSTT